MQGEASPPFFKKIFSRGYRWKMHAREVSFLVPDGQAGVKKLSALFYGQREHPPVLMLHGFQVITFVPAVFFRELTKENGSSLGQCQQFPLSGPSPGRSGLFLCVLRVHWPWSIGPLQLSALPFFLRL